MLKPVQIVIGRNTIKGRPLDAAAWGRFQAGIITFLADEVNGVFYDWNKGLGVAMNGTMEANLKVDGALHEGREVDLEAHLSQLRATYEQAVILLIYGELEVIA